MPWILIRIQQALDEIASTPARGPRDSTKNELISQLLTFDEYVVISVCNCIGIITVICTTALHSFDTFRDMMAAAAVERAPASAPAQGRQGQYGNTTYAEWDDEAQYEGLDDETLQEFITQLSALGFSDEEVDRVLSDAPRGTTLDRLVIKLTSAVRKDNYVAVTNDYHHDHDDDKCSISLSRHKHHHHRHHLHHRVVELLLLADLHHPLLHPPPDITHLRLNVVLLAQTTRAWRSLLRTIRVVSISTTY